MTTKPPLPELKPSGNTHGNPLERRRGFLAGMGGDGLPVIGRIGRTRFRVSPWTGSTLFRLVLVNEATGHWVPGITVKPASRLSPSTGSRFHWCSLVLCRSLWNGAPFFPSTRGTRPWKALCRTIPIRWYLGRRSRCSCAACGAGAHHNQQQR